MDMDTGWYYHKKHGERFIRIEDIAAVCKCSMETIVQWFGAGITKDLKTGAKYLDAGDLIRFLVEHDMPINASLFPPHTKKLLMISADSNFHPHEEKIEILITHLTKRGNLLVEKIDPGYLADLEILSSAPDIIVYFHDQDERQSCKTLMLITSFPEVLSIVFAADISVVGDEVREVLLKAHLVADKKLPTDTFEQLLLLRFC